MLSLNKDESNLILMALLYRPFGGKSREKLINKIVLAYPELKNTINKFDNSPNKACAFTKDDLDCI